MQKQIIDMEEDYYEDDEKDNKIKSSKSNDNVFRCNICRNITRIWLCTCSSCGEINTLEKRKYSDLLILGESIFHGLKRSDESESSQNSDKEEDNEYDEDEDDEDDNVTIPLGNIDDTEPPRFSSGDAGLDHVLGSGLVRGSVVALYGPPGIGKSTLLTKVATRVANHQIVLYAAGEESAARVSRRVKRLKLLRESPNAKKNLIIVQNANETDVLCALIIEQRPVLAIVDSFASIESDRTTGRPGGPSQVAYASKMLVQAAREAGTSIIAIGHETKEGRMAGPSVARHEVDTLLAFEHVEIKKDGKPGKRSDIQTGWIRLRADGKNRDGDTQANAIYKMTEHGLVSAEEAYDQEFGSSEDSESSGEMDKRSSSKSIRVKAGSRGMERKIRSKKIGSSSKIRENAGA